MMSLTFGLFTQVSSSGPLGPLVSFLNMSIQFLRGITEIFLAKEKNCVWLVVRRFFPSVQPQKSRSVFKERSRFFWVFFKEKIQFVSE